MNTDLVVKTTYVRNYPLRKLHRADCRHAASPVSRQQYDPEKTGHLTATPCKVCKPEVPRG
jgi:hypothetical protein